MVKKKEPVVKQEKAKRGVIIDESSAMSALKSMKAITAHELARVMNVKISIANRFIKELESKGIVERVGGYSGHRVYKLKR